VNVLVVTPWYEPQKGGVATAVTELCHALAEQGHTVSVILKKSGSRKKLEVVETGANGLQVCSLLLRGPVDAARPVRAFLSFLFHAPGTLWALWRFVREQRIEVVNLHYPTPSDIYWIVLRLVTATPVCITIHGSDLLQFERRPLLHRVIVRGVLRAADRIVHSTRAFRDRCLIPAYPAAQMKAAHIPLAMRLPEAADEASLPPFALSRSFVLCVAVLNPKKGVDVLIRAFAELAPEYPDHDLIIVGDGASRNELEAVTRDTNMSGRILFAGALPRAQVIGLMRRCLFFVLPSRFEAFGLVNLEAHACRKAVVSTLAGGIPEVVEHGVSGLLVEPDDISGLRDAMRTLLQDGGLRAGLGQAGFDALQARELTWRRYAQQCVEVFAAAQSPKAVVPLRDHL
jgi:glycosyltransferase involved in cell wall biosynthesis